MDQALSVSLSLSLHIYYVHLKLRNKYARKVFVVKIRTERANTAFVSITFLSQPPQTKTTISKVIYIFEIYAKAAIMQI